MHKKIIMIYDQGKTNKLIVWNIKSWKYNFEFVKNINYVQWENF